MYYCIGSAEGGREGGGGGGRGFAGQTSEGQSLSRSSSKLATPTEETCNVIMTSLDITMHLFLSSSSNLELSGGHVGPG